MINTAKGIENCGGEENYNNIIKVFCRDGRKRLENLKKGFEKNDLNLLSIETHSLKSIAATLGADELAEYAREVNQICKKDQKSIIASQRQTVIRMYQEIIEEFENKI